MTPTPLTAHQRLLAAGLVLGVTLVAFEMTAAVTALPTIAEELGGDSLYGVALAAYTLANLVALVAGGRFADRRGPTPTFLVAIVTFVIGLLVAGFAQSMGVVVIGRALQGAGAGGFAPIAYLLVKRAFPDDRQAMMYALLSAGWVLPSLVAPAFGGIVTEQFGWRWVFFAIVPMAVAVGAMASLPMRRYGPHDMLESPDGARAGNLRILVAFGAASGVAAVVVSLRSANMAALAVGTLAGAALAIPTLRRLLPAGVFIARTGQPAVVASRFLATATFMGVDGFVPLAAARVHGATPTVQGFVIIGAALTWTLGQTLSAKNHHVSARTAVRLGFGLLMLGVVLVSPVLWSGWPLWATFVAWSIGGLGMGILFNPTTVAAMSYATEGTEGDVSSQVQLADALGFSLMGGIGGATVAFADRGSLALESALLLSFGLAATLALVGILASRGVRPAP
ncbi:MAG: major facilitator superfamily protein [Acidimicrobiaceae bacterium]|nr:MAG: major facilitator superfamily protein [Acidimicrobiaceae bacterium]